MGRLDLTYRTAIVLGRVGLKALDLQVVSSGAEHIPASGPVLLASTHVSYPDFVFLQAGMRSRRRVRYMCRHDVWKRPWSWPMDRMRHIPVDRTVPAAAYLQARSLLREGEAVGAFPEGGISYSFTVRPLMKGVAGLARELQVPVVPVALWGSQRLYTVGVDGEQGPYWTRGRRVDVAYGEPLHAERGVDLTEFTRELGQQMSRLLDGLQRLPHHQPAPGEHALWHPAHLGGHAPTPEVALPYDNVPKSAVTPTWSPSGGPPAIPAD